MRRKYILSLSIVIALTIFSFYIFGKNMGKIEITLVDRISNQPLSNINVMIQELILCEVGSNCNIPALFQGVSNKDGKIYVSKTIFDYDFNILVKGYYVNGVYRKRKNSDMYDISYSDNTSDEFNYKEKSITILIENKIE